MTNSSLQNDGLDLKYFCCHPTTISMPLYNYLETAQAERIFAMLFPFFWLGLFYSNEGSSFRQ